MEYVRLGKSGLTVSRICLGCMSYGAPQRGTHIWSLPEEQSRPFFKHAIELGINFFDTANVYSEGTSEEFLGRAMRDLVKREDVVIATKVHGKMSEGPNGRGLSRKAIMQEIDASLKRLGMDYVDLYQTHRWDYDTPIEETLEAMHDVVKAGKTRYIGASSMHAWQFAKAQHIAERNGWTKFVSMQNHYNLIYREEEREMMPLCLDQGVGVIPWSPLARGRLARPWQAETNRIKTDEFGKTLYHFAEDADKRIVDQLSQIALARKVSQSQVALAWMLGRSFITAPIVGATKLNHLEDAAAAVTIKLTDDEIKALESPYVPHPVIGFS